MRAPRFLLHLQAHYRQVGDLEWHVATTFDVSSSGALFHADNLPPLNSLVEFQFSLASGERSGPGGSDRPGAPPGDVVGEGRVVRLSTGADQQGFAVTFERYDIKPRTFPTPE
jgi:hypothetical protein